MGKMLFHQEEEPLSSTSPRRALHTTMTEKAKNGDIVTVRLQLTPENGVVLEPLFDTHGELSFVLGGGNYLPGLHEIVQGMTVGERVENVSIDGGWGTRNSDLVIEVPKSNFRKMKNVDEVEEGAVLNLKGGIQVTVLSINEDTVVVDGNHPLAGAGYSCDVTLLKIDAYPVDKRDFYVSFAEEESPYQVATWAMGCFWGGELAFMRLPGVVGTRVGYTQGVKPNPTYEEVCHGNTRHREAIMVTFDSRVVSYSELLDLYMERLAVTANQYKVNLFDEDDEESLQYQHGIYFHNDEQRMLAEECIASNNNKYNVEMLQAARFYEAEEYHQQYLLKGGQSAKKGCKETIRCFG